MNPVKHASNNVTIRPPNNWDDRGGQLRIPALHATQGQVAGMKAVVTYWEPTADELSMLLAGGKVQLTCLGGQPPCNVSAVPPNGSGLKMILPN